MKKATILLLIPIVILLLCGAQTTRAIHPDTPLYEEADFSSAIITFVPQNAQVVLLDDEVTKDNVTWVKVQYGSFIGFTKKADLYSSENAITYSLSHIKATSKKMGQTINIYESNSTQSNIITTVKDGTKLIRVDSSIDYSDFYEISYNQQRAFILKQNATASLTYNQIIAVIIGSVTVVAIILMIVLINIIKNHKKRIKS